MMWSFNCLDFRNNGIKPKILLIYLQVSFTRPGTDRMFGP